MLHFLVILLTFLLTLPVFAQWNVVSGSSRESALKNFFINENKNLDSTSRQEKYQNMRLSAFSFYRGAAAWYYRDLMALAKQSPFQDSRTITWLQGDMHVANIGAFSNDQNQVVFNLNDFDESWTGNYLLDVWRLAISIFLVAKENGLSMSATYSDAFGEWYLDTLDSFLSNNNERNHYLNKSTAYGILDEFLTDVEAKEGRNKMLAEWTTLKSGVRTFNLQNQALAAVSSSERSALTQAIGNYHTTITSGLKGKSSYFKVLDVAKRLHAGTGSLGSARFYVLIAGDSSNANDDRILDVKAQGKPAIYNYLTSSEKSRLETLIADMGCRVANAEKALLNAADDHLGCVNALGLSFSVRERSPYKKSFPLQDLDSSTRLTNLAEQWGVLLAAAHARADQDFSGSLIPYNFEAEVYRLTDKKHAEFRAELHKVAKSYAEQVAIDYAIFIKLLNAGAL
jgi:uncharacterized protein (DUF2252 family)